MLGLELAAADLIRLARAGFASISDQGHAHGVHCCVDRDGLPGRCDLTNALIIMWSRKTYRDFLVTGAGRLCELALFARHQVRRWSDCRAGLPMA
jgi:hypothetical protein